LYALHCGACHGASGDGNGRAAPHLFPKPLDLRTGKARLVSTVNGVPTLADLESAIRRGMPGTSMQAFDNLSEDQRRLLAEEVRRMNREGIREQFTRVLRDEGEEIDDEEVREVVELCTTPGEAVPVPQIGPADSQAIARGKDTYFNLGCDNCHGDDGIGVWDMPLFDDKGRPSPPRDLARDPFKGGEEPESVYLRIYVGMPGTAHPACSNVPEDQLIDVVHYCRSLSREPKRVLTNHQRALQATSRPYLTASAGAPKP
jgi:mono/diheme cytochrome c family protein